MFSYKTIFIIKLNPGIILKPTVVQVVDHMVHQDSSIHAGFVILSIVSLILIQAVGEGLRQLVVLLQA